MPHYLIFGSCLLAVATTTAAADDYDSPLFKITTKRDDDRVGVKGDKDKVIFSVHSPFGISNAVIERDDDKWPKTVTLRLHLEGLESFQAMNKGVKLEASVSSQDGKGRLWKDGMEDSPLDPKSPFWMEIRMFSGDGKPTKVLPLKDGYIEMELPKKFFEGNPKTITVSWIDFYRN